MVLNIFSLLLELVIIFHYILPKNAGKSIFITQLGKVASLFV